LGQKRIAVLGSTGSIGRSVLDVVARLPEAFKVVSISGSRNTRLLAEQAERFAVSRVAVGADAPAAFRPGARLLRGAAALEELAADPDADLVVNAIVGAAGLRPTVAALRAGKRLALANKESLVMAGEVVTRIAAETGAEIIPIDSEHSAIFRCLNAAAPDEVAGLVLTASGGALRDLPIEKMSAARVEDVLAHPTWRMGAKVTVDSATLVNKAMEVIEARWLFAVPFERIEIVVHRESFVHSFVRLTDGSLLAHLGEPDMRVPIQFALCYPEAAPLSFGQWRPGALTSLSFEAVDARRYPCLEIMLRAAREGGTGPAVAAGADEVAVEAFVGGAIRITDIAGVIAETLAAVASGPCDTLEAVLDADARAREAARACVALAVARST
jgi:1-deoxy-D-xylulose-5-phosphate reductoisomerase